MPIVLRIYEDGEHVITEYTKDGINVSHTVKIPKPSDVVEEQTTSSTPEQVQAQILMNTELLVMYKELGL